MRLPFAGLGIVLIAAALSLACAQDAPSIYMTVVTNCSDFINFDAHCKALERHLDLMQRYDLKVDYSFTAPLIKKISEERPELFARLKQHGLSYHGANRPPHPFPRTISQGKSWEEDFEAARQVESVWRDLLTGEYAKGEDGGIKLWKKIVGGDPWMCGRPCHAALLAAELQFAQPRMAAGFKDNCGLPSNEGWWMGVLGRPDGIFVKPSDLKRYALTGKGVNPIETYEKQAALPRRGKPLFINLGMHLHDFYLQRGWADPTYIRGNPGERGLQPGEQLSAEDTDRIFALYERCLSWAAEREDARITTLQDLLALAQDDRAKPVNQETADLVARELRDYFQRTEDVPLYINADTDYFTLTEAFQALCQALAHRANPNHALPATTRQSLGPTKLYQHGDMERAGRQDVVAAAETVADALQQGIPSVVTVGQERINAAQFLLLMAEAWLEPDAEALPVRAVSTVPRGWLVARRTARRDSWLTNAGQLWGYKPARWKFPQDDDLPPLYIVSMMHAEEQSFFLEDEAVFSEHARNLRALVEVFKRHGAKVAVQPDWTFIEGAKKWDPELFTWLIEQGMGVDAHAHATQVTVEDVARKLTECGVEQVRIGNGDFQKQRPQGANWVWPFARPGPDGDPFFDALVAYKDVPTQTVDTASVIWRPATAGDWHVHNPDSPILYIGTGPMGQLRTFDDLRQGLDIALKHVRPGVVNTFHWHDSVHKYGRAEPAKQRTEQWDQFLGEVIDPLVRAGKVKWATFSEMVDAHLELEWEDELALEPGDIVPQIESPLKYGNLSPFIRQLDRNQDGAVDGDEFAGPEEVFKRLDRDGDGFIRNNEAPQPRPQGARQLQPQRGER